jgi:hypothetical protein
MVAGSRSPKDREGDREVAEKPIALQRRNSASTLSWNSRSSVSAAKRRRTEAAA